MNKYNSGGTMEKLIRMNVPLSKGRLVLQCLNRNGKLQVVTLLCGDRLLKLGGFEDIVLNNCPDITINSLAIYVENDEFEFICDDKPTLKASTIMDFLRTFKIIMTCMAFDIIDKFDILSKVNDEASMSKGFYSRLSL
jgi:hypothetical protein